MSERSPLLPPDAGSVPAMVVHTVAHDASAQQGFCCMNDGVKSDVLCVLCKRWICRAHQGLHCSNREPFDQVTSVPCISQLSVAQHRFSPVCPRCAQHDERPPGYPRHYINRTGKVSAVLCVIVLLVIGIAVATQQ